MEVLGLKSPVKLTIYAVTRREALRMLGVPASALESWERKAKVERYPGRRGYTAAEFARLRACVQRRRGADQ